MWSILPCKLISVFIDLKHGEIFFLLQVYLKLLRFSSCYWFGEWMNLLQIEAEKWCLMSGKKKDSFFAGTIGHFGQCVKKRGLSRADLWEESQWMFWWNECFCIMALNFLGVFPINYFKMLSSLCTVYTLQTSNFNYLPRRFFPKFLLVPKCKL